MQKKYTERLVFLTPKTGINFLKNKIYAFFMTYFIKFKITLNLFESSYFNNSQIHSLFKNNNSIKYKNSYLCVR